MLMKNKKLIDLQSLNLFPRNKLGAQTSSNTILVLIQTSYHGSGVVKITEIVNTSLQLFNTSNLAITCTGCRRRSGRCRGGSVSSRRPGGNCCGWCQCCRRRSGGRSSGKQSGGRQSGGRSSGRQSWKQCGGKCRMPGWLLCTNTKYIHYRNSFQNE